MTTKTAKAEMMKAHAALGAVLDEKLGAMPEWRAFRAVDRALVALEDEAEPVVKPRSPRRTHVNGAPPSYMSLADKAIGEAGRPVPTSQIMDFIGRSRKIGDFAKAKIVVQSSLSKDKRFKSVPWDGARGWWYADRPIPRKETAA